MTDLHPLSSDDLAQNDDFNDTQGPSQQQHFANNGEVVRTLNGAMTDIAIHLFSATALDAHNAANAANAAPQQQYLTFDQLPSPSPSPSRGVIYADESGSESNSTGSSHGDEGSERSNTPSMTASPAERLTVTIPANTADRCAAKKRKSRRSHEMMRNTSGPKKRKTVRASAGGGGGGGRGGGGGGGAGPEWTPVPNAITLANYRDSSNHPIRTKFKRDCAGWKFQDRFRLIEAKVNELNPNSNPYRSLRKDAVYTMAGYKVRSNGGGFTRTTYGLRNITNPMLRLVFAPLSHIEKA